MTLMSKEFRALNLALIMQFILGQCLVIATPVSATPVTDPTAPIGFQADVYNSANGVPVVNITAPSGAGVSRNQFSDFSVDSQGVVLNNALVGGASQLAGELAANPNFAGQTARVIVNEVTSSNLSVLKGLLEVFGDKAQVIIANPNGISCDGCGFINTSKATLATARAVENNGAIDLLIRDGQVTIEQGGLYGDETRLETIELLSRHLTINGEVVATHKVRAVTGVFDYKDVANEQPLNDKVDVKTSGSAATTALAIDGTEFGALRAGAIDVMATESGLGVNVPGYLGAEAGDLFVDVAGDANLGAAAGQNLEIKSEGKTELLGRFSAEKNITVNATAVSAQAGSALNARETIAVATSGKQSLQELSADDILLQAQSLSLNDTIVARESLEATASNDISLASTGEGDVKNAALNSQSVNIEGKLRVLEQADVQSQTLNVGQSGLIAADDGKLSINSHAISNQGRLSAKHIEANTQNLQQNIDGELIASQLLLNSTGAVDNAGDIVGKERASLALSDVTNQTTGLIQSKALTLEVNALTNHGKVVGDESLALSSEQAFTNSNTGQIAAGKAVMVLNNQTVLKNQGSIEANELIVNAAGLQNTGGSANIKANRLDFTLRDADSTNTGVITAFNLLALKTHANLNNQGVIASKGNMTLWAADLVNQAAGRIVIKPRVLGAQGNLVLQVATLANQGSIASAGNTQIMANSVTNTTDAASFTNATLHSDQALAMDVQHAVVNNAGAITAKGNISITAEQPSAYLNNTGTDQSSELTRADIASQKNVTITGFDRVVNSKANTKAQQQLTIITGALNNADASVMLGATGVDLTTSRAVANLTGSEILSGQKLLINAGAAISNDGLLQGKKILANTQADFNNTQLMRAVEQIIVTATGSITNAAGGEVFVANTGAQNELRLNSQGALTNHGNLVSNATLTLNGSSLLNTRNIVAGQDLTVATTGDVKNLTEDGLPQDVSQAQMFAAGNLNITSQGQVHNSYGVLQSQGNMFIQADTVFNQSRFASKELDFKAENYKLFSRSSKSRGHSYKYTKFFVDVAQGYVRQHAAAQIVTGGNLHITANKVTNESSIIKVGAQGSGDFQLDGLLENLAIVDNNGSVRRYWFETHKEKNRSRAWGFDRTFQDGVFQTRFDPRRGYIRLVPGNESVRIRPNYGTKGIDNLSSGRRYVGSAGLVEVAGDLTINASSGNALVNQGKVQTSNNLTINGQAASAENDAEYQKHVVQFMPGASTSAGLLSAVPSEQQTVNVINGFTDNTINIDTARAPNAVIDLSQFYNPDTANNSVFQLLQGANNAQVQGNSVSSLAETLFSGQSNVLPDGLEGLGNARDALSPDSEFFFDPIQEANLLRQISLQETGRSLFHPTWQTEREQQQALYDNAVTFAQTHGVEIGRSLTQEQVLEIAEPMLWYEMRTVNGKKALMPVMYLGNVTDEDFTPGGTLLAENITVDINGDAINHGDIAAGHNVHMQAGNVRNGAHRYSVADHIALRAQRTQGGGNITAGNNLHIASNNDIYTEGGRLQAGKNASLKAQGDITLATATDSFESHIDMKNYRKDVRRTRHTGTTVAAGNNVNIQAGGGLKATAATIAAGNNANITAKDGVTLLAAVDEDYSYEYQRKDKKLGKRSISEQTSQSFSNQGSSITAGGDANIVASEGALTMVASTVAAGNNIVANARDGISLVAGVDEQKQQSKQEKVGTVKTKSVDQGFIKQQAVGSAMTAGNNLHLITDANIDVLASTLGANQTLNMGGAAIMQDEDGTPVLDEQGSFLTAEGKPVANVTIGTVQLSNEEWHDVVKGYRGPVEQLAKFVATAATAFALTTVVGSGKEIEISVGSESKNRTKRTTHATSTLAANNLNVNATDNITLLGASVTAFNSANMEGENIVIDAVANTTTTMQSNKSNTVKGIKAGINSDEFTVGGVSETSLSESTTTTEKNWAGTEITAGNLTLNARNNLAVIASTANVADDVDMAAGNNLTIGGRQDSVEVSHKRTEKIKETSMGVKNAYADVGFALQQLNEARKAVGDAKDALKQAKREVERGTLAKDDLKYYEANLATATYGLTNATLAVVGASANAAVVASGSIGTGFYVSGKATVTETTTEENTLNKTWHGSAIQAGGNAKLASGKQLAVKGSDIDVAQALTLEAENIAITAGDNDYRQTTSRKTTQESVSGSSSGMASASVGQSESESTTTSHSYQNSFIQAGSLKSNSDSLLLSGANVSANDVTITTNDLVVESLQDTSTTRSDSKGVNMGMSFGSGGVSGANIGGDKSKTRGESAWVSNQTTLTGSDSITINAKNTTITGATIAHAKYDESGNLVDQGGLALTTDTLTVNKLHDYDDIKTSGGSFNVGLAFNGKQKDANKALNPFGTGKENSGPDFIGAGGATTVSAHNNGHKKRQTNHATLGGGSIIVGGQAQSDEQLAALGVNQDLDKAQEITLDQKTGGLNASVTLDHRLFSDDGQKQIKDEAKKAGEHVQDVAYAVGDVVKANDINILNVTGQIYRNTKATMLKDKLVNERPDLIAALQQGEGDGYLAAQKEITQIAQKEFGLAASDVFFYDGNATTSSSLGNSLIVDVMGGTIADKSHSEYGNIALDVTRVSKDGLMKTAGHEVIETAVLQGGGAGFYFGDDNTKEAIADSFGYRLSSRLNDATGGALLSSTGSSESSWNQTVLSSQAVTNSLYGGTRRANQVGNAHVEHARVINQETVKTILHASDTNRSIYVGKGNEVKLIADAFGENGKDTGAGVIRLSADQVNALANNLRQQGVTENSTSVVIREQGDSSQDVIDVVQGHIGNNSGGVSADDYENAGNEGFVRDISSEREKAVKVQQEISCGLGTVCNGLKQKGHAGLTIAKMEGLPSEAKNAALIYGHAQNFLGESWGSLVNALDFDAPTDIQAEGAFDTALLATDFIPAKVTMTTFKHGADALVLKNAFKAKEVAGSIKVPKLASQVGPDSGTVLGRAVVPNNRATYTGDVYDSNFVGPVEWEYFYRGDATQRSSFLSSMSETQGVRSTDDFLDNLSSGVQADILAEHGVSSSVSPFIGTSKNPVVADYFARGPQQAQDGFITTFRVEAREARLLQDQGQIVPNFENPMSFFEPNPRIGVPESEFLFRNSIDTRYIFQKTPVKGK